MSRILSWLREPFRVKQREVDWRDFSRSFGRVAGGCLDSGEKDTPSSRAWDRGGKIKGDERPPARWMVIGAVLAGLTFWGAILTVVLVGR
jgi:hypothetical protein